MIFNIFCDASIDTQARVACGGCYIVLQQDLNGAKFYQDVGIKRIIQLNATNNSSEILAIKAGVVSALQLRQESPGATFRLFSDSKISLYGLRDWMKSWISRIQEDGTLISSSGQPVMNQQYFIDIFNLIVENNLHIELYHQRGHVTDGKVPLDKARAQFIRANKVPPENLGLDIDIISRCNNVIDHFTRFAVKEYINTGVVPPEVTLEGIDPIIHHIKAEMLHQYIRCIDKTTVKSHHDFKGGYNQ